MCGRDLCGGRAVPPHDVCLGRTHATQEGQSVFRTPLQIRCVWVCHGLTNPGLVLGSRPMLLPHWGPLGLATWYAHVSAAAWPSAQ